MFLIEIELHLLNNTNLTVLHLGVFLQLDEEKDSTWSKFLLHSQAVALKVAFRNVPILLRPQFIISMTQKSVQAVMNSA